jgi:hypothetical protein
VGIPWRRAAYRPDDQHQVSGIVANTAEQIFFLPRTRSKMQKKAMLPISST